MASQKVPAFLQPIWTPAKIICGELCSHNISPQINSRHSYILLPLFIANIFPANNLASIFNFQIDSPTNFVSLLFISLIQLFFILFSNYSKHNLLKIYQLTIFVSNIYNIFCIVSTLKIHRRLVYFTKYINQSYYKYHLQKDMKYRHHI